MRDASSEPVFEVNRGMLRSGVGLMGFGGFLWLAGATVTVAALGQATRRWAGQLEESPRDMARRRVQQLKVAALAGTDAWRHQAAVPAQRSSSETPARV